MATRYVRTKVSIAATTLAGIAFGVVYLGAGLSAGAVNVASADQAIVAAVSTTTSALTSTASGATSAAQSTGNSTSTTTSTKTTTTATKKTKAS